MINNQIDLERYKSLNARVSDLQNQRTRSLAVLENLKVRREEKMEELRLKFGVSTLEEAQSLLESKELEVNSAMDALEVKLSSISEATS